jgi:hypothetical protein
MRVAVDARNHLLVKRDHRAPVDKLGKAVGQLDLATEGPVGLGADEVIDGDA